MKLLVVEDEPRLLKGIGRYFRKEKFFCEGAASPDEARRRIGDALFDCIILDIDMPGGSDLQLLNDLRTDKNDTAVIIVSASDSPYEKIKALGAGADDYLTKPLHLPELAATVKALLRRRYSDGNPTIDIGVLRIDLLFYTVTIGDKPVGLSRTQFALLFLLARNKDRFVSSRSIVGYLHEGSPEQAPGADFVYRQIKNLKRKLKGIGCPVLIKVSYRFGYMLSLL